MRFKGASRDQVSFDSNGNGLGAYDITVVNIETEEWEAIGSWISNTSNVLDLPANASFLNLNLTKLRMLWTKVFNSSTEPTSFCGQQCPPGYWMSSEERYKVIYTCIKSNQIIAFIPRTMEEICVSLGLRPRSKEGLLDPPGAGMGGLFKKIIIHFAYLCSRLILPRI